MKLLLMGIFAAAGLAPAAVWIDLSGPWQMDGRKEVTLPIGDRPQPGTHEFVKVVDLPSGALGVPLALTAGEIGEWYEIRIDGKPAGTSGSPHPRDAGLPRPRIFPVGPFDHSPIRIEIRASRFDDRTTRAWWATDAGPWILSSPEVAPRDSTALAIARRKLVRYPDLVQRLMLCAVAVAGLLLYRRERHRKELLWVALFVFAFAFNRISTFAQIAEDSTPFRYAWHIVYWREWIILLVIAELARVTAGVPAVLMWPLRLLAVAAAFGTASIWNWGLLLARILLFGGLAAGLLRPQPRRPLLTAAIAVSVYTQNSSNSIGMIGLRTFEEATIAGFRFHPFVMVATVVCILIWWPAFAGAGNQARAGRDLGPLI